MMYGIIYKATNLINNHQYIGQTIKTLEERTHQHFLQSKNPKYYFHRALNQYGSEHFLFEVVDSAESKDELNQKEMYWIKTLETKVPLGYNGNEGGTNYPRKTGIIRKRSSEHNMKISVANKGKKLPPRSEEHKKNLSLALKGKTRNGRRTLSEEQNT